MAKRKGRWTRSGALCPAGKGVAKRRGRAGAGIEEHRAIARAVSPDVTPSCRLDSRGHICYSFIPLGADFSRSHIKTKRRLYYEKV
jgi:hypothetical protein